MQSDPRFSKANEDRRFARFPHKVKKLKLDERFSSLKDLDFHRLGRGGVQSFKNSLKVGRELKEFRKYYKIEDENKTPESGQIKGMDSSTAKEIGSKVVKGLNRRGSSKRDNQNCIDEEFSDGSLDLHRERVVKGDDDDDEKSDLELSEDSFDYEELLNVMESNKRPVEVDDEDLSAEFSSDSELENELGDYEIPAEEDVSYDIKGSRLAVIDLEWDNLSAQDLLVICNSFIPVGGSVKSVTIYFSDYGLKNYEEDCKYGPRFYRLNSNDDAVQRESIGVVSDRRLEGCDSDSKSRKVGRGQEVYSQRLREYLISRKRYYFAVIECNEFETALSLYNTLDENEVEYTTIKMNLRFIPDELDFSGRKIKDRATEIMGNYQPSQFVSILCKTKLRFKFDETPRDRVKFLTKSMDLSEEKLSKYIASGSESGESGEDIEEIKSNYRNLVKELEEAQMEVVKPDDNFIEYEKELSIPEDIKKMIEDEGRENLVKAWKKKDREDKEMRRQIKLKKREKLGISRVNGKKIKKDKGEYESSEDNEYALSRMNGKNVKKDKGEYDGSEDNEHVLSRMDGKYMEGGVDGANTRQILEKLVGSKVEDLRQPENIGNYTEGDDEKIWEGFEDGFSKSAMKKSKKRYKEQIEAERAKECEGLSLLINNSDVEDRDDAYNDLKKRDTIVTSTAEEKLEIDERFGPLLYDPRFIPDPTHPRFSKSIGSKIINARKEYKRKVPKDDHSVVNGKRGFFDNMQVKKDNIDVKNVISNIKSKFKTKQKSSK